MGFIKAKGKEIAFFSFEFGFVKKSYKSFYLNLYGLFQLKAF
jgi:hypothetical protein